MNKKKAAFTGLTTDFIGKISQVGDTFPPINKQLYITCRELICYYILKEYCTQVQLIYLQEKVCFNFSTGKLSKLKTSHARI